MGGKGKQNGEDTRLSLGRGARQRQVLYGFTAATGLCIDNAQVPAARDLIEVDHGDCRRGGW